MTSQNPDIRLLIELYVDDEIDAQDRIVVERALSDDAAAQEYFHAVKELSSVIRVPIDHEVESVSFHGLFERVMAEVGEATSVAAARNGELEMLAMAMADGEALNTDDTARVGAYLASNDEARDAYEGLGELGELIRIPIEREMESVDFAALAARIEREVAPLMADVGGFAPAAPDDAKQSMWQRLTAFFGANRAVFASAVVSAAVVAIMVPMLNNDPTTTPGNESAVVAQPEVTEIHYHYYGAETVDYNPGYWGASQPGNMEEGLAPVIWIASDAPTKIGAPAHIQQPAHVDPHADHIHTDGEIPL